MLTLKHIFLHVFYFLDKSYIQYFGNSYLEFKGIDLSAHNNITVSFQTTAALGTLLYVDQGPVNGDFFFMKLFIQDGILQVKTVVELLDFSIHFNTFFLELAVNKIHWANLEHLLALV